MTTQCVAVADWLALFELALLVSPPLIQYIA